MPRERHRAGQVIAALLLVLTAPVSFAIAIGIWLSDSGPVFYLADRVGLHGSIFRMWKFRTMRSGSTTGSRISAPRDPRAFPFGALLRKLRLDELPQLLNIARGDMAFVGPRPEDPWFVDHVYSEADRQTLEVLPGLTSPGTLYYLAHAERFLSENDTEVSYVSGLMKQKLQLDRMYVSRVSAWLDARLIFETIWMLACVALGRRHFPACRFDTMIAGGDRPGD